jgi:uncharacterized protein (TIGR02246 family)
MNMERIKRVMRAAVILLALCLALPGQTPPAAKDAVAEVQAAFDRYVDAWKRGDMEAFAAAYADDPRLTAYWPDPTRVYPITGWENVRKALAEVKQLIGGMDLEYADRNVQVFGDVAVLTANWTWVGIGKTNLTDQARSALLKGHVSFIFERRGSRWVVIHEHSSVPFKI